MCAQKMVQTTTSRFRILLVTGSFSASVFVARAETKKKNTHQGNDVMHAERTLLTVFAEMEASLLCKEESIGQIREYARQLHTLVSQYKWIAESYVVEFFVKDHWSRLPPSWQLCLAPLSPPQVAEFVFSNRQTTPSIQPAVWPLSLLAFKAATLSLTLSRSVANPAQLHAQSGRNPDLSHCYRTHVKPKKQHEIERLAEVIHDTCEQVGCHDVIDVGSGRGHLSRLLSFGYGHRVTSIEAVDCHVTGAAKFDHEVKAYIEKKFCPIGKLARAEINSPNHVVCTVHPYITVEEFLSVIRDRTQPHHTLGRSHSSLRGDYLDSSLLKQVRTAKKMKTGVEESDSFSNERASQIGCQRDSANHCKFQQFIIDNIHVHVPANVDERPLDSNSRSCPTLDCELCPSEGTDHLQVHVTQAGARSEDKFLIAGLHTCGDLGPTMLRTFVGCSGAVALASVACCYMRMSFCDKSFPCKPSNVKVPSSSLSCSRQHESTSRTVQTSHDQPYCSVSTEVDLTEEPKVSDIGFPMSAHVQSLCEDKNSLLTFEPLELACHFIEGYRTRLRANDPSLLTQGYRAVLEVLIQEQSSELSQSQDGARKIRKAVSSVKKPHQIDFHDYASNILGKLNLSSDDDRIQTLADTLLPQWHKLVTYHSIRQLLAPIIESLVLVDRTLFLLEKGIESSLVPLFDPLLSPRNLVLLAVKKSR